MRMYPVPFSTREENKLFFNLTLREFAWLLGGLAAGLAASGLLAVILNTLMLFCLPAVLPFLGLAWLLGFARVKEYDHRTTFDRHLLNSFAYRSRPRDYVNYRRP